MLVLGGDLCYPMPSESRRRAGSITFRTLELYTVPFVRARATPYGYISPTYQPRYLAAPFNFERRLFQPFEYALPPPPHYSKENIAWRKPDLEEPPSGAAAPPGPAGLYGGSNGAGNGGSPLDSDPLAGFTGPQCFAIPGSELDTWLLEL